MARKRKPAKPYSKKLKSKTEGSRKRAKKKAKSRKKKAKPSPAPAAVATKVVRGTCTVTVMGVPASKRNYTKEDCISLAEELGGTYKFVPN